MKRYISILLLLLSPQLKAQWRPNEALLKAVRKVESSNGAFIIGDEGRSLGDFQLSEAAWLDVSNWRKAHGKKIYAHEKFVLNPSVNREYASDYLTIIRQELRKKLKRSPSSAEIYAAYNMGLGCFAQCKYSLARVNPVTARKCSEIQAFVEKRVAQD